MHLFLKNEHLLSFILSPALFKDLKVFSVWLNVLLPFYCRFTCYLDVLSDLSLGLDLRSF